MRYSDVRGNLLTGDIVAIDTRNKLTRFVQHIFGCGVFEQYTHVGILIWRGDSLHVVEMDGRFNVERPLSQYTNAKKSTIVFRLGLDNNAISTAINKHMRDEVKYDYSSFFTIGARLAFGLGVSDNPYKQVCTDFIVKILDSAGYKVGDNPLLTPSELCCKLGKVIYKIDG
jgi:hypothetical protein